MTLQEIPPANELVLCPPQRILVVEDDPAISHLIVKLLEYNWFYTVSSCNGSQAAGIFDPKTIDLLITDLRMEGGGGIELIKKVRMASDTPIIIVTAFAAEYANEVRFLDGVSIIHKPFDARLLLRAVDKALPMCPPSFEPPPEREAIKLEPLQPIPISPDLVTHMAAPQETEVATKTKILIADDDPEYLLMLGVMLKNAGYEVVSASTVEQATQLAAEQNPALMLLDIHMGEDDGYAIQEKLDQIEHLAGIPVVYISGDQSNWIKFTIAAMGANGVLRKPFDRKHLLDMVRKILA